MFVISLNCLNSPKSEDEHNRFIFWDRGFLTQTKKNPKIKTLPVATFTEKYIVFFIKCRILYAILVNINYYKYNYCNISDALVCTFSFCKRQGKELKTLSSDPPLC